jgi:cytochrome P450
MADTMSPGFMRDVAGPHNHTVARSLIQLWKAKEAIARGRPFDIASDLEEVMNDSIFAVAFGVSRGGIDAKLEALSYPPVMAIERDHEVIVFPKAKRSAVYDDIGTVLGSPEIALKSPFGAWHLAFALKFYPKLRLAVKRKDVFIQQMLDEAWEKFNRPTSSETDVKSAAEFLIAREVAQSSKSGRKAQYDSPMVKDELFLFLFAGFDTGPTTVKWGTAFTWPRVDEFLTDYSQALNFSLSIEKSNIS